MSAVARDLIWIIRKTFEITSFAHAGSKHLEKASSIPTVNETWHDSHFKKPGPGRKS